MQRTKIVRESWRCCNAICLPTYANGSPSVANALNKRITTTATTQQRYMHASWEASVRSRGEKPARAYDRDAIKGTKENRTEK